MQGIYLYADFCSGRFWGLKGDGAAWQNALLLTEPHTVSSFDEDEAGNLFIADLSGGAIYEIVAPNHPPSTPSLVSPADGTTGAPATVAFEWRPSADPEGDQVSYRFFLGTDPSFAGVVPIPVARIGSGKTADPFKGPGFPQWLPVVLFLSGILFTRKSAKLAGALILAGILWVFGISGCGSGGGACSQYHLLLEGGGRRRLGLGRKHHEKLPDRFRRILGRHCIRRTRICIHQEGKELCLGDGVLLSAEIALHLRRFPFPD